MAVAEALEPEELAPELEPLELPELLAVFEVVPLLDEEVVDAVAEAGAKWLVSTTAPASAKPAMRLFATT